MIEGADLGSSTSAVATDESVVIMDDRVPLNTSQAEGLKRALCCAPGIGDANRVRGTDARHPGP